MKSKLVKLLLLCLTLGILGGLTGVGVIVYYSYDLPKISSLDDYRAPMPSQILSRDGEILAEIGQEKRDVVPVEEVPDRIINSFLAAEDDSFYQHNGVDYQGVLRALVANIRAGRVVQGGSTITQQVAKSLLLSSERSITRKIKDFLLAIEIEKKLTKKEILFLYLNQVYLGGGYYGVKRAFQGYFDKELTEATVAEAAMVAGLLVAPSTYSPYNDPQSAYSRQHYVLKRLRETGKISEEEYQNALSEKIKFRLRKPADFKAGYFTEWVRQRVVDLVGSEKFLTEGYKIQTTLDWELQQVAEKEVLEGVLEIDKRQGYKGPEKQINIKDSQSYRSYIEDKRKEFYRDRSLFFTINDNFEREYEQDLSPEELETIIIKKNDLQFVGKRYPSGVSPKDPLVDLLEKGPYKAVVTKALDKERIVFVELMGIPGVIAYDGFRWAHERIIQEDSQFFSSITEPSTILHPGDEILVTINGEKQPLEKYILKSELDDFKKSSDYPQYKNELYLSLDLSQAPTAQGALVSLKAETGEILSMVGGTDFKSSQFNRAIQSLRQPGSSFKPLLFAAGLEYGYAPNTIIIDSPEALGGADQNLNWKPRNYDGQFKGPITYRNALEQSRNVPTIKIALDLGVDKVTDFMKRIGFRARLDPDLSLSLGSFGVTLLDLVSTYAIFPNGGELIDPISIISITDREGNEIKLDERVRLKEEMAVDESTHPESEKSEEEKKETNPFHETLSKKQVYDQRLAYIMTNILKGVVNNPGATGRGAREVSTFLGGKTGTTNNFVDAWFLGFSSNVVTGAWTGFDDNSTLGWGETGAKAALPIWKGFMKRALSKYGEYDFKIPPGIVNMKINKDTGRPSKGEEGFVESFVLGFEPGTENDNTSQKASDQNGGVFEDDEYYNN